MGYSSCDGRGEMQTATMPLYGLTEAALYAKSKTGRLRHWTRDYNGASRVFPAILDLPEERFRWASISFANLIEAAVVEDLKDQGLPLSVIRVAHAEAAKIVGGTHPFARSRISICGHDVLMQTLKKLEESSRDSHDYDVLTKLGQRALSGVLRSYAVEIEFSGTWPASWWPGGCERGVELNPEIEFGRPQVRGVRTEVVRSMRMGGAAEGEIAEDLRLGTREVHSALAYEASLRAA